MHPFLQEQGLATSRGAGASPPSMKKGSLCMEMSLANLLMKKMMNRLVR